MAPIIDAIRDQHRSKVRADKAEAAAKPGSNLLVRAQFSAAKFEEGVSRSELTKKAYEDVRERLQAAKEELEQCEEEYGPRDCAIELK